MIITIKSNTNVDYIIKLFNIFLIGFYGDALSGARIVKMHYMMHLITMYIIELLNSCNKNKNSYIKAPNDASTFLLTLSIYIRCWKQVKKLRQSVGEFGFGYPGYPEVILTYDQGIQSC